MNAPSDDDAAEYPRVVQREWHCASKTLREAPIRELRNVGSARSFSCPCRACEPAPAMSRRQFLCTGTAGAVTAAS